MTAAEAGRIALALDALVCDPEFMAQLDELGDLVPSGLRDQLAAAGAQVAAGMRTTADQDRGQHLTPQAADVAGWLRLGALAVMSAYLIDEVERTCPHAPNWRRPGPIAAAAWRPGLIVCGRCTHLLALPPGSPEDRTCDGCGRIGDPIRPNALSIGNLAFLHGTCRDCHPLTT